MHCWVRLHFAVVRRPRSHCRNVYASQILAMHENREQFEDIWGDDMVCAVFYDYANPSESTDAFKSLTTASFSAWTAVRRTDAWVYIWNEENSARFVTCRDVLLTICQTPGPCTRCELGVCFVTGPNLVSTRAAKFLLELFLDDTWRAWCHAICQARVERLRHPCDQYTVWVLKVDLKLPKLLTITLLVCLDMTAELTCL